LCVHDLIIVSLASGNNSELIASLNYVRPGSAFSGVVLLAFALAASAEPDFSGIWMLQGRAAERELVLTDEGQRIQAAYDLLEDDPSLQCVPASISRVWANPNVRIGIDQSPGRVLISYEFFDLRRDIPLGDASVMTGMPSTQNVDGQHFQEMGSSYARYEGDRLVIDTRNHVPGYIRTSRGVPQSEHTVATEELWLDGDKLKMTLTYVDEKLFEIPFILDHTFIRTDDLEVPLYECTDADYDWFEKLNAPQQGESQ
jgi:hypothetical protein